MCGSPFPLGKREKWMECWERQKIKTPQINTKFDSVSHNCDSERIVSILASKQIFGVETGFRKTAIMLNHLA